MSRLHTSFVLGYHGCTKAAGEDILSGRSLFKPSCNDYDWLGSGIYFGEADPKRALEWAIARAHEEDEPFVLGAVIDLGNCLDLMAREDLQLVLEAYNSLVEAHNKDPMLGPLPRNVPAGKLDGDILLRRRDCATINHLHSIMEAQKLPAFDTVRGLFTEGGQLYAGSGFFAKTHVQIAVRTIANIKAVFRPQP